MNKNLKKLLMGLFLVPGLVLTTACDKDTKKNKKDDTVLNGEAESAAYSVLYGHATNVYSASSKAFSFKTDLSSSMNMKANDSVNLNEATKNVIDEMFALGSEEQKESYVVGYDLENGVGYAEKYEHNAEEKLLSGAAYLLQEADKYVLYTYEAYDSEHENGEISRVENKNAYYVGKDHLLKADAFENFDYLSDVIEVIKDAETLEEFKEDASDLLLDEMDLDFATGDLTTTYNITKVDNVYSLNAALNLKGMELDFFGMMLKGNLTASVEIKFNESSIISAQSKYEVNATMTMPKELLGGMSSEDILIDFAVKSDMKSYDFKAGLDEKILNADYSSYVEGEISPKDIYIETYINDARFGSSYTSFGSLFNIDAINENVPAGVTVEWYLDDDYTISASAMTSLPSYNVELYGKIKSVAEGYAAVVFSAEYVEGDYITHDDFKTFEIALDGSLSLDDYLNLREEGNIVTDIKVNGQSVDRSHVITFESGKVYTVEYTFNYTGE